MLKKDVG